MHSRWMLQRNRYGLRERCEEALSRLDEVGQVLYPPVVFAGTERHCVLDVSRVASQLKQLVVTDPLAEKLPPKVAGGRERRASRRR